MYAPSAPASSPASLRWIRILLAALFLAGAYRAVGWYLALPAHMDFTLIAALFAVPGFFALLLSALAGRRSKGVFAAILLTACGFLVWSVLRFDDYSLSGYPEAALVQITASIGIIVLLIARPSRDHYLGG
ncbi:hypothetical protein [Nocardiopsis halophila]|uniref:hypothetical protein n=1 Tax=Nocardiopsis halophila TaxID=141692 RepID=UPI00034D6CBD|nr:hypothetical protein [Nocardiopsis halophila]